jgi:hypothetical protein
VISRITGAGFGYASMLSLKNANVPAPINASKPKRTSGRRVKLNVRSPLSRDCLRIRALHLAHSEQQFRPDSPDASPIGVNGRQFLCWPEVQTSRITVDYGHSALNTVHRLAIADRFKPCQLSALSCLDGAPCQECLAALRTSRVRSCLRPVCAGLRSAGPDDSSAWLFASITVSHAIRCRQCIWLPSLIRWFTSPLGHPRLRFAGIQRYTARNVIDNLSLL